MILRQRGDRYERFSRRGPERLLCGFAEVVQAGEVQRATVAKPLARSPLKTSCDRTKIRVMA